MRVFGLTIMMLLNLLAEYGGDHAYNAAFYPATMVVIEVDYENDNVVMADFTDNCWNFKGCEDWSVGDICSVLMCDNGTESIYDDFICETKYSGYVSTWGNRNFEEPQNFYNFDTEWVD